MAMTRAEFLRSLIGTGIGAVMFIGACSGDDGGSAGDDGDDGSGSNVCTAPTNSIGSNHGHVLTITIDDVNAAADKTYDIMGSSPHTHSVTVTAANFAAIKEGRTINVTSSSTGHSHNVSIQCVS